MGRGEQLEHRDGAVPAPLGGPSFEDAEDLRGVELQDSVLIARSALENWARFRGGREEIASARAELLAEIREHGRLSGPPQWMTSAPAEIEAWIALPGELSLGLVASPKPPYRWLARNCFAPKRVRKQSPPPRPLRRARLEGAALERALALSGGELERAVGLSLHARERYASRAGAASLAEAERRLRDAIRDSGRVVARIPEWADAAGHGGAALLIGSEEEIALPLLPSSTGGERELIASTCIPRAWSEGTLDALRGDELAAVIHVSSRVAEKWGRRRGLELEQARAELERLIAERGRAERNDEGIVCECGGARLRLRAAEMERIAETGRPWTAIELL